MTVGPGDIPGGNWVFGTPGKRGGAMFMILNLAVGGDGGGPCRVTSPARRCWSIT